MDIPVFAVETWMSAYGKQAQYNIADTCADCMTMEELLAYGCEDRSAALHNALFKTKLDYGDNTGSPELKSVVAGQYGEKIGTDNILLNNGAVFSNFLVLYTLIRPGDHVIGLHPSFQQLYEVPMSLGAKVDLWHLRPENDFVPDLDELRNLIRSNTKLIVINNPNNPTGTLLDRKMLTEIAEIARSCGAYILSDEVCLHMWTNDDLITPSIINVYEKGIATSSLSKAMSFPGLRMGWVAAPKEVIQACTKRRDYLTISCGVLNDMLAIHAVTHIDEIMARNRTILRTNLNVLDEWKSTIPQVTCILPRAGTAALLKIGLPYASEVFCKELLQSSGVLLTPGSFFGMEGYVRIGCAVNNIMFKEGLVRAGEFLNFIHSQIQMKAMT